MKKRYLLFSIMLILTFIIKTVCFFAIVSGQVTSSLHSFSIDSDGNLYLGKNSYIEVLRNNEVICKINPQSSRAYVFRIEENDHILLSTSVYVYEMELDGSVLSTHEDINGSVYNKLQSQKSYFCSSKGDEYRLINWLGRYMIEQSGQGIIYKMPLQDYLCCALDVVSGIIIFICLGVLVIKIAT